MIPHSLDATYILLGFIVALAINQWLERFDDE